jgi:hypothetical protein
MIVMLLLSFALALPAHARSASDPAISGLVLDRSEPVMELSFAVVDAFSPDIEEAVMGGIPTTFTMHVELERVRGLWFNPSLYRRTFTRTVKYDTLRQEFEITADGAGAEVVKTRDAAEMKRLMTTAEGIKVIPKYPLTPGGSYKVRVKAELRTVRLPFLLEHVLIFVKFWDVETDWFVHSFTH